MQQKNNHLLNLACHFKKQICSTQWKTSNIVKVTKLNYHWKKPPKWTKYNLQLKWIPYNTIYIYIDTYIIYYIYMLYVYITSFLLIRLFGHCSNFSFIKFGMRRGQETHWKRWKSPCLHVQMWLNETSYFRSVVPQRLKKLSKKNLWKFDNLGIHQQIWRLGDSSCIVLIFFVVIQAVDLKGDLYDYSKNKSLNVLISALNLANWNFIKAWAMKNLIFVS